MALLVQKYGGTSVGSIERIKSVAERVGKARDGGDRLVVVVSAMAGGTNRLFLLSPELSETPDAPATDLPVPTGEKVSRRLSASWARPSGDPARSNTSCL